MSRLRGKKRPKLHNYEKTKRSHHLEGERVVNIHLFQYVQNRNKKRQQQAEHWS